jgi:hypothetical protein
MSSKRESTVSANDDGHKEKRAKANECSKLAPIDPKVLTPANVAALAKSYQVREEIICSKTSKASDWSASWLTRWFVRCDDRSRHHTNTLWSSQCASMPTCERCLRNKISYRVDKTMPLCVAPGTGGAPNQPRFHTQGRTVLRRFSPFFARTLLTWLSGPTLLGVGPFPDLPEHRPR